MGRRGKEGRERERGEGGREGGRERGRREGRGEEGGERGGGRGEGRGEGDSASNKTQTLQHRKQQVGTLIMRRSKN